MPLYPVNIRFYLSFSEKKLYKLRINVNKCHLLGINQFSPG